MLIILGCLLIIFLIFAGILYRRAQNKTVTSVLEDGLDEQVKNEPLIGFDERQANLNLTETRMTSMTLSRDSVVPQVEPEEN